MNKDFTTLEKILCNMADNLYQPVEFPSYSQKLDKEHAELQAELNSPDFKKVVNLLAMNDKLGDQDFPETLGRVKDELADVLVFVLRISNKFNIDGKELLVHAMGKMINLVSDTNYNNH